MILRKYMSLIGIGSARIDLQLPKSSYEGGDTVNGSFIIEGGTIDQQINRIECDLVMTDVLFKREKVIDSAVILTSTVVYSQERSEKSFTFRIPEGILKTTETVRYHFKTRLYFQEGVESKDQDGVTIL